MNLKTLLSTLVYFLVSFGVFAALALPLQKVLLESGKTQLSSGWKGEVREVSQTSFTIPEGAQLKFEPLLSNFGNRVLFTFIDSRGGDHVSLWERNVGTSMFFDPRASDLVVASRPAFTSNGNRAAFFIAKRDTDGADVPTQSTLYVWEDGFEAQAIRRASFFDSWTASFDPNGTSVLLTPRSKASTYTLVESPTQKLSKPLLLTFESRYTDRLLRFREPQANISFSLQPLEAELQGSLAYSSPSTVSTANNNDNSHTLSVQTTAFKSHSTPFDIDRDGAADLLLFARAAEFPFWKGYTFSGIEGETTNVTNRVSFTATWRVGDPAGVPVVGDYNGDGIPDLATFTPLKVYDWNAQEPNWKIYFSVGPQMTTNRKLINPHTVYTRHWGQGEDIAVPGDYDGDGTTDLAVFDPRRGNWQILFSSGGFDAAKALANDSSAGLLSNFGKHNDIPVPGDFDGNGTTDLAVFHLQETSDPENQDAEQKAEWRIHYLGTRKEKDEIDTIRFGKEDDIPLPADYDGDGKYDVAVYRPSEQKWLLRLGGQKVEIAWGIPGAEPLVADFDGDGKTDLAFYNSKGPTKWYIRNSRYNDQTRSIFIGDKHSISQSAIGDVDGLPPQVWLRRHQMYLTN